MRSEGELGERMGGSGLGCFRSRRRRAAISSMHLFEFRFFVDRYIPCRWIHLCAICFLKERERR